MAQERHKVGSAEASTPPHPTPPQRVSIAFFAEHILKKPLYPYQVEVGDAIIDSVLSGAGHTFTVMMSRQSGKNQISAAIEAYLLFCMESGTIVKAAPTYKPQVIASRMRLLSMLETPLMTARVWRSFGFIIGLAPDASPASLDAQLGPRILFFSAEPESSIVGATASLLLEVDEAQDVAIEKYDVELKPMAAVQNATTVMYGTAWSDDTLLARQRAHNLELERADGIRRHFEFDWHTLAAINPKYRQFVESEIARLGEDHISIRTQYRLLPISGAGFFFSELQRHLLHGPHQWISAPAEQDGEHYIAGLDVGGEERPKPGQEARTNKRDSTVLTIARVSRTELDLPRLEIVHQYWWTGVKWIEQYEHIKTIMELWNVRKLVIDATGLGEALASLLTTLYGEESARVQPFKFSRPSKSRLAFQVLTLVNSGRMKLYQQDEAPPAIFEECWKQIKLARYAIPGEGLLNIYVDPSEGHDDFLMSLALTCEAMRDMTTPVSASAILHEIDPLRWTRPPRPAPGFIAPRPLYDDGAF